ncbi:unnamed protein product [Strongylus vulgaris]|uniref:Uncharacterized protein n=1 Tax=Strongylus vulgaris TaxID=40348 RepID=A0A3P7LW11_STRVU|nr:unnamed protein product [Strongylus vulgaris]
MLVEVVIKECAYGRWTNEEGPQKCNSSFATLVGCNNAVTRLDFEAESRLLLGASNDHGVRLWNVDNQRLVSSFMGHTDRVSSARFLSSHQVVSGSNDRLIKLWDVRSQRCDFLILKAKKSVRSVFPGSTILDIVGVDGAASTFISERLTTTFIGHFDRKLRFWDSRNQEPVHIIEVAGKVTSLNMSLGDSFESKSAFFLVPMLFMCRWHSPSLLYSRRHLIINGRSKVVLISSLVGLINAEQYRTSSDLSRCVLSPGMQYCAAGWARYFVLNFLNKTTNSIIYIQEHLMEAFSYGIYSLQNLRKCCTKEDMTQENNLIKNVQACCTFTQLEPLRAGTFEWRQAENSVHVEVRPIFSCHFCLPETL